MLTTTEPSEGSETITLQIEDALIEKLKAAQRIYSRYSQEQVDRIFKAAAMAALSHRIELAQMAIEETGMGVLEDKILKNHFAAENIYNQYKNTLTCGVIEENSSYGIKKVAEPLGIIAGVIPTTNPTSTTIFKTLLALKTRNGIIITPHHRAKKSTIAAARIVLEAAVKAGAPEHIISWIAEPTRELTQHLMSSEHISLILATGGPGMVHAAYSSGKPALGVGAGNTPVIIDETADIDMTVSAILLSKTFDNGLICASEQSVIAVDAVYEKVKKAFKRYGAYFLSTEEKQKLVANLFLNTGALNTEIIGHSACVIAEKCGFSVPPKTKLLLAEVTGIGSDEPMSGEKLSPTLALYHAPDITTALEKAKALLEFAGMGHTTVLYTNKSNQENIRKFGVELNAGRMLINMPSSQGAIGDLFNFKLTPSLTLGCGSWGNNSISENVGVKHLLNIKTIAERRENMLWFRVPPRIYFKYGCLPLALKELSDCKKAFIVTGETVHAMGHTNKITRVLDEMGINFDVFCDVAPDPTLTCIRRGVDILKAYKPDVIIALGGGSPIDAAKMMWLLYESPDENFENLAMRFMDIRKRVYEFPKLRKKARLVAIPTTSGTGSEVTPFAVITDDSTGIKYPLADYEITPDMAIIDYEFVVDMPKQLTAHSGVDALTHAIEAFASVCATEYTNGLALEAIRLVFKYLPAAYHQGAADLKAREKLHYASTIAGMAFANAFLGICHSMAHQLGAQFHIPHGLANILLLNQVIHFNATDVPTKQTAFSQYETPSAKSRYAQIADHLHLGGKTDEEKVERLINAINNLKRELNIPLSIKDQEIPESDYANKVDTMALQAYDDQCTGTNPRYPLIHEIKELYRQAYAGIVADI